MYYMVLEFFFYFEYDVLFVFVFFFFQAEDGIRDLYVTGVQTCALPISVDCGAAAHDALACAAEIGLDVVVIDHHLMREGEIPRVAALVNPNRPDCASGRSEERRVGKECRSRWSAQHEKKNKKNRAR